MRAVQHLLSEKFGYDEMVVDGNFGPITNAAARDFQAAYDLRMWRAWLGLSPGGR